MNTLSDQDMSYSAKNTELTENDKMMLQLPTENDFLNMLKNDSLSSKKGVIINQKYTVYHKYSRTC